MNHYLEIGNLISRGAPHLTHNWHIGNFYLSPNWLVFFAFISAISAIYLFISGILEDEDGEKYLRYVLLRPGLCLVLTIVLMFAAIRGASLTEKGKHEFNQALTQVHHKYPYYAKLNGKNVYCTSKPQLGKKITFVTIHNDAVCPSLNTKYVSSHKQEAIAVQVEKIQDSKKSLKNKFSND